MKSKVNISLIKEKLGTYFYNKPVHAVYVFGSVVTEDFHENSDIDFLVDLDYENGADFFLFLQMKEELSELMKNKVDLVSSNGLSKHLQPIIEQQKVLIYSKNHERQIKASSYS